MRNLAIMTTAMLGLALATPSYAQPGNSAPQPGLPPGAGVGAQNAQPPRSSGVITSSPSITTAPNSTTDMPATSAPTAMHHHHRRHHTTTHHHRTVHHTHPTTPPAPAVQ